MTGKIAMTIEDGELVCIETTGRSGLLRIAANYLPLAAARVDEKRDLDPGPITIELNHKGDFRVTQP